jgi:hypothetical protein
MERGPKIAIKILIFILIFLIISIIPIFVKFSIVESVYDAEGGTKEHHLLQTGFELSNFYKAVFDRELAEQNSLPSYIAPIINIILAIVYSIIVFGIINIFLKVKLDF